jgi:hypothetical protein
VLQKALVEVLARWLIRGMPRHPSASTQERTTVMPMQSHRAALGPRFLGSESSAWLTSLTLDVTEGRRMM